MNCKSNCICKTQSNQIKIKQAIRRLLTEYANEKERNKAMVASMDQYKQKTRARVAEVINKRQRELEQENEVAKRRIVNLEEEIQSMAAAAAVVRLFNCMHRPPSK